jgi:hypothetical protein
MRSAECRVGSANKHACRIAGLSEHSDICLAPQPSFCCAFPRPEFQPIPDTNVYGPNQRLPLSCSALR